VARAMSTTDETALRTAIREKVAAAGTSFYLAMRLLPEPRREAMYAIYAFCREVDDIADEENLLAVKQAMLDEWRREIDCVYAGTSTLPLARILAADAKTFALRREDFLAIIDGMAMDAERDIRAPSLADLDLYCDRVASAVGRLSIKIFGMDEDPGFDLAHHLGRALQLTNILRDVDEDAAIGRLYLPREYLEEMDCCRQMDPAAIVAKPEIDMVCRKVAALAHRHYDAANRILAARPKGRIKTPRLMGAVYSEILRLSEAQGFAPPRHRASLPKSKLLSLVLRQGLFS
jgi:phytoene synthase